MSKLETLIAKVKRIRTTHRRSVERMKEKCDAQVKGIREEIESVARATAFKCFADWCGAIAPAPEWEFEWATRWDESASRGPWSEPVGGYIRESVELSTLICPHCGTRNIIALHEQRDEILLVLRNTEVIRVPS